MPAGTVVFPSPFSSTDSIATADVSGDQGSMGEMPLGIRETFRKWDPRAGIAGEVKRWEVCRLESVLEACEGEDNDGGR